MIKGTKNKLNLHQYVGRMPIIDTDPMSRYYFRFSEFPDRLHRGKNLIRLNVNGDTLVKGSSIQFEFLDSNGNPLYHEVLDYIDKDQSRVIVVYVYDDTPLGPFNAYFTGLSEYNVEKGIRYPVGDLNQHNLIWMSAL